MDAKAALRAVGKHWIVFTIAVLLGIGAGVLVVFTATPKYASTVTFFVSTPATDNSGNQLNQGNEFATQRVNTYVRLVDSDLLARRVQSYVADNAGDDVSIDSVQDALSATADLNTVLLTVTATDTDRGLAQAIARGVGEELPGVIRTVEPTGADDTDGIRLTVVSGPRAQEGAIRPSRLLNIGLGFVVGVLVGLLLAIARELLDRSVRGSTDLRETLGLPVVGIIPRDNTVTTEPLVIGRQVRSIRAEAFRQLRTNLQFMNVDRPVQVLVVTSSIAAEGKSTTSANLAIVFAETGRSTLLIEADMRRPRVTEYLGLERSVGLSNVLSGQVAASDVLQPWGDGNLVVLASGPVPPNPSEMIGSNGMAELLDSLREQFDVIILDTPPMLPVTDAAVASVRADGVILVVRHGHTNRGQAATAVESLDAVGARVLGTVLNMAKGRGESRGAYDGYGYYEDADAAGDALGDDGLVHVLAGGGAGRESSDDTGDDTGADPADGADEPMAETDQDQVPETAGVRRGDAGGSDDADGTGEAGSTGGRAGADARSAPNGRAPGRKGAIAARRQRRRGP